MDLQVLPHAVSGKERRFDESFLKLIVELDFLVVGDPLCP